MKQRPAWHIDRGGLVHYLWMDGDRCFRLDTLDSRGRLKSRDSIAFDGAVNVKYFFSIQETGLGSTFVAVGLEEGRVYRPYLLAARNGHKSVQRFDFVIPYASDIAAATDGRVLYFVTVDWKPGMYRLLLRSYSSGQWLEPVEAASGAEPIRLPQMALDSQGRLHFTWKQLMRGKTAQFYQRYDPAAARLVFEDPVELGPAAMFFGGSDGRRAYVEDVGPRLAVLPGGDAYVAWTVSRWDPMFSVFYSEVNLARVTDRGEVADSWKFRGKESFAVLGDIAVDSDGSVSVLWEDYIRRGFRLYWSHCAPDEGGFAEPRPFIRAYGSQRFAAILAKPGGGFLYAWRELRGSRDKVWFRDDALSRPPAWTDRWSIWFSDAGFAGFLRESFVLMLYSLVAAMVMVVRNAFVVVMFILLLYMLERQNILPKCNFLFILSVCAALLAVLKGAVPALYGSAVGEAGFMLFSSVLASLLALLAAHKHWFEAGEELTYLKYITLWMFADAFLGALYTAPGMFAPW